MMSHTAVTASLCWHFLLLFMLPRAGTVRQSPKLTQHGHRRHNHLVYDKYSPLSFCPMLEFEKAFVKLYELQHSVVFSKLASNRSRILERYKQVARNKKCAHIPSAKWPISDKKIVVNIGEGTTGTRYLTCMMNSLGFKSAHPGSPTAVKEEQRGHMFLGCEEYESCTAAWDDFNYISDSPVPYFLMELLLTHPKAVFLLSMREPTAWKTRRIKGHLHDGSANWHQAGLCGPTEHKMNHTLTELDYTVYNVWAMCVARDREIWPLIVFNQSNYVTIREILTFLMRNKMSINLTSIDAHGNETLKEAIIKTERQTKLCVDSPNLIWPQPRPWKYTEI
eukprot:m.235049 g.235049  ORF g.235049 m.235049 type:complete len:336 (-) comp16039_c0_seq4:4303-5310(-)